MAFIHGMVLYKKNDLPENFHRKLAKTNQQQMSVH